VTSEIARVTDRLLSEVAAREPLPPEEEARLARLVAEGGTPVAAWPRPAFRPPSGSASRKPPGRAGTPLRSSSSATWAVVRMTRRYRWSGIR